MHYTVICLYPRNTIQKFWKQFNFYFKTSYFVLPKRKSCSLHYICWCLWKFFSLWSSIHFLSVVSDEEEHYHHRDFAHLFPNSSCNSLNSVLFVSWGYHSLRSSSHTDSFWRHLALYSSVSIFTILNLSTWNFIKGYLLCPFLQYKSQVSP